MSGIPTTWDLEADVVGCLVLCKLDTTAGDLRFILNEEGWYDDINGDRWYGSKLVGMSDVEFSVNGTAPQLELSLSYTVDPDVEDLVSIARQYGVSAIRNRDATFYLQYVGKHEELFAPAFSPIVIATRKMMNLRIGFEGPKTRTIACLIEGAMNLRSRPVNGRYTDTDQRRRTGVDDPSFEFMPNNSFDEQSLFGL